MNKLFLAWQDPKTRSWFPIGCLEYDGQEYSFFYINGVKKAQDSCDFQPLHSFPDLKQIYRSPVLFPLFSNRLMKRSRPDYKSYIQWLNISQQEDEEPMVILARSGGHKATDTFEIFPCPEPKDGLYQIYFFVHGLRYMPECSIEEANKLNERDVLYLTQDFQNPYDEKALLLRTENKHNVGYCPRYLLEDISELIKRKSQDVKVHIEKINLPPTPSQYRLLCKITAPWGEGFKPFSSHDYKSFTDLSRVCWV